MTTREQQIQARCQAATPGPWTWSGRKEIADGFIYHPQGSMLADTMVTLADTYENDHKDLDFIAHSREDIPYLLERLRACEAALERSKMSFDAIRAATLEGRVCDDVAWFDTITTLHDYCADASDAVSAALAQGADNV